jgi:heptosyltransferase I
LGQIVDKFSATTKTPVIHNPWTRLCHGYTMHCSYTMPAMMNVLIVRTSSMGDLIHTWPALTDLARHYPNVRVSWLTEENFVDIAGLHPSVQEVIPLAWRRWRKRILLPSTWCEIRAMRNALQATKWDLIIDSQGLLKSAIPARMAGNVLVGLDWKSCREPIASLLYSKTYRVSWEKSAVNRNRELFSKIFGYTLSGEPVFDIHEEKRPDWVPADNYAMLLHATSKESKEWPENQWVELADRLNEQSDMIAVFPWGNPREHERAVRLTQQCRKAICAPRMTLREAAGALSHATAVVGVDTGLSHLANALAVPLVAIYTDTDPASTGVVETRHAVNLGGVGKVTTVDEVLSALLQRMESA